MNKLKMMIVYNNNKGIEKIKNAVENIEYIEVVGSTKKGKEVYKKIERIDSVNEKIFWDRWNSRNSK